jgi:hypothetical protein
MTSTVRFSTVSLIGRELGVDNLGGCSDRVPARPGRSIPALPDWQCVHTLGHAAV